ncbi:MAG TPA: radical SAM protein [Ruminococcaceae bacterium]|nr:radical SAM protein [Oscillospiraceae bacterium]
MSVANCTLCPRQCGSDRTNSPGYCGGGENIRLARAALHFWEEPCISGKNGSGTVFFSGCQLKCCFCQNYKISAENFGKEVAAERLAEIFLELQAQNASNINLVSPTHYAGKIIQALDIAKPKLKIPVVYNSSGYENIQTLKMLEGYVDVYLPDIKYMDSQMSKKYSNAENYFEYASKAVLEMFRQVGKAVFDENGLIKRGLIIRHLVLPKGADDTLKIIDWISNNLPKEDILLSLMSQYTPCYKSELYPEINRKISTYEYNKTVKKADELGFKGYAQQKSSAKEEYTPPFDLEGV